MAYTVNQIIEHALIWHHNGDSFSCHVLNPDGTKKDVNVSFDELRTVRPHIPELLDAMIAHRGETASTVLGQWLRITLKHEDGLNQKIESYSGVYWVDEIIDIDPSDIHNVACIKVVKYGLRFQETEDPTFRLEYAVYPKELWIDVAPSWMDTTYPGWKERLDIAVSMDVVGKDRVRFVCENQATSIAIRSDDLSFDVTD